MTTIIEEKNGCIIYCEGSTPIIIDTPFYKETDSYKERIGSAVAPGEGTLAEGIDLIHLFVNGAEQVVSKADLLREASMIIYNYGAEIAKTDGYKKFDPLSTSGQKGISRMIDVITLILMQIQGRDAIIRIPYLMDFDYSHKALDEYSDYYVVHDFDFGDLYDSISHSLPKGWKYNTALSYSFVFTQYFKKQ